MKSKELARRTFRAGEFFLRFFDSKNPDEPQYVRFVSEDQIQSDNTTQFSHGIEVDPDDIETPVRYHRKYMRTDGTMTDEYIDAKDIIHGKIRVDSDVKRGVSFYVGIAYYITQYANWLKDRIRLNKIRSLYNIIGEITGDGTAADIADQFIGQSGRTRTDDDGAPRKIKTPKAGGILLNQGIKWKLESLNINAADTKDDGHAILLMIVAGTNLAEYMVTGDASNANFASTMVAESPAVRAFEAWQDVMEKFYQDIFAKVIQHGIENGNISSEHEVEITDPKTGAKRLEVVETSTECTIEFPVLIHHDVKAETEALALARDRKWVSDRTCSTRLGWDYDEEREQQMSDGAEDEEESIPLPAAESSPA